MKTLHHPIRTTILFGLICGITFILSNPSPAYPGSKPTAICGSLWLLLAVYAALLCRWGRKPFSATVFPLIFLFAAIFLVDSANSFFLLSLAAVGWIRSGVCFKKPGGRGFLAESVIAFIGGGLLTAFEAHSAFDWALSGWMFFLVQAVYFVLTEDSDTMKANQFEPDPFERASREAEAILDCQENIDII
jgi:hypothetical protein